jgi:hypothetical protein
MPSGKVILYSRLELELLTKSFLELVPSLIRVFFASAPTIVPL